MAALLKLEVTKSPAAPLRQQVEGVLRQAIIDGKLAPGQRLTERALTERIAQGTQYLELTAVPAFSATFARALKLSPV